ncbi:hypothetical protein PLICRDRAFT_35581 [Plicaturopsis crispa FD-325 SS-3]|nr:hypothetical protein PLICRDRAFT_35581 [Plicaturopsis crispa FD-325 SS-3]
MASRFSRTASLAASNKTFRSGAKLRIHMSDSVYILCFALIHADHRNWAYQLTIGAVNISCSNSMQTSQD